MLTPPVSRQPGTLYRQPAPVRLGWAEHDLDVLGGDAALIVIVDVLRFSSAVTVATGRGAAVVPCGWDQQQAAALAGQLGAVLAGRRESGAWSLSPSDLGRLPAGTVLVLPSPNGSALSERAARLPGCQVTVGSVRNASAAGAAVAATVRDGGSALVLAAGERWPGAAGAHRGPVRVAVEDGLGAGLVLAAAVAAGVPRADLSPEAQVAALSAAGVLGLPDGAPLSTAPAAARDRLRALVAGSVSGRELVGRGWLDDLTAATALDADDVVPVWRPVEVPVLARSGVGAFAR